MKFSLQSVFLLLLFVQIHFFFNSANAQISTSIDFVADKTTGCAPEVVKFTAIDAPAGSQLTWIIDNDTITNASSEQTYLFGNSGTHDVTLSVKLINGSVEEIAKNDFVKLGQSNDNISLNVSRNFLCNGVDTVTFITNAKGASQFDWIIDGTNYLNKGNKIIHRFKTAGYKNVTVRVKDSSGCYGLKEFTSVVYIATPPVIDFTVDKTFGCAPLKTIFTPVIKKGSSEIATYEWLFPGCDILKSNTRNPAAVNYSNEGEFDVILNVTTKDGCKYTVKKTGLIKTGNVAKPTFSANKKFICPGDTIIFTNTSSGKINNNYSWKFSGGEVLAPTDSVTQKVVFTNGGSYDATLIYINNGCELSNTIENIVITEPVKADFIADHLCGCRIPDTIRFINKSSAPGNFIVKHNWTFFDADGKILNTSTERNPSFVYTNYGKYKVRLAVTSATGCTDVIEKDNYIDLEPIDSLIRKYDTKVFCKGEPIELNAPKPHCGDDSLYTFTWTFYDKNDLTKILKTVTGQTVKMAYSDTGLYSYKLNVTSAQGCVAEKIIQNFASIVILKPGFTVNKTVGCESGEVILKQNTTPYKKYYTHSWILTHKDDTNIVVKGSGETFVPVFPKPGVYNVKYIINVCNTCFYTKEVNSMLSISGIKGDFTATQIEGCLPFTTTFKSNIIENIHYNNKSEVVKYEWSAIPATSAKFSDPDKANTDVLLTVNGPYTIVLKMTNSDGCVKTITKPGFVYAGVSAAFSTPNKVCYGDAIKIINQSSKNAVNYKWSGSNGVNFSANNVAEPVISFEDKGTYKINLYTESILGCKDSITRTITVERVKAMFTSMDTINTCAPAYVSFTANKMNADSFIWFFGDGEKLATTDSNVAHVYKLNSGGNTDGFDVMLVAKSKMGCTDTLLLKKYIKVIGPVPAFSMSNTKGCEPLKVDFTNNSKNTVKWYLDYNDFSRIDSQAFGPQIYTVQDPKAEFAVFKPRLLAKDKFGCTAWAYANDSIVVYNKPVADFTVNSNEVCFNTVTSFTQTSTFAAKYFWDFNNDGIIDDTARNPKVTLKPGVYTVKLKIVSRFGCVDSVVKANVITVQPEIKAEIKFNNNDTICAGTTSSFILSSEKPELIKNIEWYINDEKVIAANDGLLNEMKYSFTTAGSYAVKAKIESNFGCQSMVSAKNNILVPDTSMTVTPPMYVVTVTEDSKINISWSKAKSAFFKKYKLFREENNSFIQIYESASKNDTILTDNNGIDVNASNYTYRLQTEDFCANVSLPSSTHTTVLLKISANTINQLDLNWSAYKGWANVKQYNIYRSENGITFDQIAVVNGDVTNYIDNSICNKEYSYYVVAVQEGTKFISRSNTSKGKPDYKLVAKGENIIYASVTNDKNVELKWNATVKNSKQYIIDRFENGNGWINNYAYTDSVIWTDKNANVHNNSYTYRIRIQNECGDITEAGTIGRNILLKAKSTNDNIKLSWNSYAYWTKGIRNYQIEILNKENIWKLVAVVSGNDTSYIDNQVHEDAALPYNYRVIAIEKSSENIQSVSNTAKVMLPSRIFVPNAFTPNNDGRNDDFKPETLFINEGNAGSEHNYKLQVFNRWGEKLFETNKLSEGWDGTYRGTAVPEGVYIYIINAMGYDWQSYYLNGNIHLLK